MVPSVGGNTTEVAYVAKINFKTNGESIYMRRKSHQQSHTGQLTRAKTYSGHMA
jgi:hypothetical protein